MDCGFTGARELGRPRQPEGSGSQRLVSVNSMQKAGFKTPRVQLSKHSQVLLRARNGRGENSLAVQWLELCAFMAEGVGLKKKGTGGGSRKGEG